MQTLYAICALVCLMFLGITVQKHVLGSQQGLVRTEVSNLAVGIAAEVMNQAAALRFDSAQRVTNVSELTPSSTFGGALSPDDATVIHQLDGLAFTREVRGEGGTLSIDVRVEVRYVSLADNVFVPSVAQTPYKEVRVLVSGIGNATFELSRVFGLVFNT